MGAGAEREIDTPASVADLVTDEVGPAGAALRPVGRAAAAAAAAGGAGIAGPMYSEVLLDSGRWPIDWEEGSAAAAAVAAGAGGAWSDRDWEAKDVEWADEAAAAAAEAGAATGGVYEDRACVCCAIEGVCDAAAAGAGALVDAPSTDAA